MKGKIVSINKLYGEHNVSLGYSIIVEFDDMPKLRLGECEIKQ